MKKFGTGEKVFWKWMGRSINGEVKEVYEEPIVKEIKGKKIKRNGSAEKPAYLVESEAGNLALKLHTELFKQGQVDKPSGSPKPTMFD